ncbi:MAG: hypothetical protein U9O49_04150 [Candidatus Thermoplasmatota archaeon]|nr:hypothetical protein [Candidatus Thermoplasmatota archaeon]
MKREAAWRIFAGEYNDSTAEIKGQGEMAPSYVVTPLGAKINRLFVIGVLTDVENVSESSELIRAHVSDPTGIFTIYSGQYQQDVTEILSNIEVPAFVAIIGKAKTYSPEEGTVYVSIRPEKIMEVDAEARNRWILETCKNTKDRIEAIFEATKMDDVNAYELKKLGYSVDLSEGIVEALKNYENIDLNRYIELIQESLQYVTQGSEMPSDISSKNKEIEHKAKGEKELIQTKKSDDGNKDGSQEIENIVLESIKEVGGKDGAAWDKITKKCEKAGLDKDSIEEALNSLMDKGLIYEPILGTIKTT